MTPEDLFVALSALAVVAVPLALAWVLLRRGDERGPPPHPPPGRSPPASPRSSRPSSRDGRP